jgi:ribosomal protein S11
MFRARIYAQGFTLAALVVGSMYWKTDRQKRKEFDAVVLERKAKEKNEAWIRELEARDAEEKQFQAMREARMKAMAEGRTGGEFDGG